MKRAANRRGMALVTVLWTMVLLTTAAMAASTMFRSYVGVMAIDKDKTRADALLSAGLESAASLALRLANRPLPDFDTSLSLTGGTVDIALSDEGGRVDIDKAPVELVASLLRSVGVDNADAIAQQIVDARGHRGGGGSGEGVTPAPPSNATAGASASGAPSPADTTPSLRPFSNVRQLANVPGLSRDAAAALAPLTTVFGSETVNPFSAPPAVIAALPGVNAGRLRVFLDRRAHAGDDAKPLLEALGPAQKFAADTPHLAVGVRLDARLDDGYRAAVSAVIVPVDGDSMPYRVLAWSPVTPGSDDAVVDAAP